MARVHCYAANFGHDLARRLILKYSSEGDVVLDPFCGSGTTLIEARRSGRLSFGIDIDPIAYLISKVQTRRYSYQWLISFFAECLDRLAYFEAQLLRDSPCVSSLRQGCSFGVNGALAVIPARPEVEFWFSPTQRAVLASLICCRDSFSDRRQRDILSVAISSTIVRKWPNTLSCAMDIDHSRPHRVRALARTKTQSYQLFERILRQVFEALGENVSSAQEAKVVRGDSAATLGQMPQKSVDLILSSPPYVNAIDYPRAHKFAEWWVSPETNHCVVQNYVGLRRNQEVQRFDLSGLSLAHRTVASLAWLQRHDAAKYTLFGNYISDISHVIHACRRVLRSTGKLVFVVANNRINSRTVPITTIIEELLLGNGFKKIVIQTRRIKSRNRRYPFGFPDRMTSESVISAR